MTKLIIGLGSNLGDRKQNIQKGLQRLAESGVNLLSVSSYLENTAAEGVSGEEFLNAAVLAETSLEPELLLTLFHKIEKEAGRPQPHRPREARTLDLDIIYYGDRVIDTPDLQVPHPRRLQRRFVMGPAAETAPGFLDPVLKKPLAALVKTKEPPHRPKPDTNLHSKIE